MSSALIIVAKMRFIRDQTNLVSVNLMKADNVKADFENLEIHMGTLKEKKFKLKCIVTYDDQMLIMDGGKRICRMHARNIGNVHLEKKAIRIAGLNFEVREGDDVSVASGSIRLELDNDEIAKRWYQELWG